MSLPLLPRAGAVYPRGPPLRQPYSWGCRGGQPTDGAISFRADHGLSTTCSKFPLALTHLRCAGSTKRETGCNSVAMVETKIRGRKLFWPRASGRAWMQSHHRLTIPVLLLALGFSTLCGWILLEAARTTETRATEVATSLANSLRSDMAHDVEI